MRILQSHAMRYLVTLIMNDADAKRSPIGMTRNVISNLEIVLTDWDMKTGLRSRILND